MRKLLFAITIVAALAACNNKASQQEETAIPTPEAQSEMTTTSPANDEGQDGWMQQSTIMSSKPMVVDFYATWCGPCKQLAPILDEIEKKHEGEVIFKRIDVDQEPELAQEFKIQAIPMLMFITPKGEYQTIVGLEKPAVIEAKIAQLLTRSAK